MGMLGMIIALPLTTLMLSYYRRFIIDKERLPDQLPPDYQSREDVQSEKEEVRDSLDTTPVGEQDQ